MDEKIKSIMSAVFGIDVESLHDKVSPKNIEQWESLNHMKLATALEHEFEIEFDDTEIVELQSFALIKLILSEKVVGDR